MGSEMCIRDSYTVTQAIAIPDSNAFLTFNNPRIYYRKNGRPSKRYGFKALAYKWNNEMNGHNLYKDRIRTWELQARIAMNRHQM